MIVLDTNVLSEIIKPVPASEVEGWLLRRPPQSLFITTVTQAEMWYGLSLLSAGRKRDSLSRALEGMFAGDFVERILPFDSAAASAYAAIAAKRTRAGRPISQFDAAIAGIALSRGAAVVTRNARDFADIDIEVLNPWTAVH